MLGCLMPERARAAGLFAPALCCMQLTVAPLALEHRRTLLAAGRSLAFWLLAAQGISNLSALVAGFAMVVLVEALLSLAGRFVANVWMFIVVVLFVSCRYVLVILCSIGLVNELVKHFCNYFFVKFHKLNNA